MPPSFSQASTRPSSGGSSAPGEGVRETGGLVGGRVSVGVEKTVVGVEGVSVPGAAALPSTPVGHSRRVGGGVGLGDGRGSGSDASSSVGGKREDYPKRMEVLL